MKRKGSKSISHIPEQLLDQLNSGRTESVNLVEWLAVDQLVLLKKMLIENSRIDYLEPIAAEVHGLKKKTIIALNATIGIGLLQQARANLDNDLENVFATHTSDSVRCWVCYMIGLNDSLSLEEKLIKIRPFAKDDHFGVREIAWMAVKESIASNLEESIDSLTSWVFDEDDNIRRFASEATRPRGVWCNHIPRLKENPSLALPLLDPLKSDPSKYVQNSVGNWLNDASKTRPDFVYQLAENWSLNASKETNYIVKRGLRTINKSN